MMEVQPATTTQQQDLKFSSPITTSSIIQKSIEDSKMEESDVSVLSPPSSPVQALAATRESVITQQSVVVAVSNSQPTQSTSSKDSLSREAIELIQNEFVRLKAEQLEGDSNGSTDDTSTSVVDVPQTVTSVVLTSMQDLAAHCSPVVTMATTGEGGQLVYCNVNDLDLASAGETTVVEPGYNLTSLASLAEASQTIQHQDKISYGGGMSTLLLQGGGVLQLKGEGSGLMTAAPDEPEQVFVTVAGHPGESGKIMTVTGPNGTEKLINIQQPQQVQMVSLNQGGQGRVAHSSQDAIASILASMNSQIETEQGVHEVEELDQPVYEETKHEHLPLNLATTDQGIIQGQPLQIQGIKRMGTQPSFQQLSTKKVIIATINGTQRILTPVSTPQFISMKNPLPRGVLVDNSGNIVNNSSPIMVKQSIGGQMSGQVETSKPKPMMPGLVVQSPGSGAGGGGGVRNPDNKTCMWKFENGQICGKVFTKTYNLTVHMRMHQDIRPFPCGVCEQTFRQKAHLQRHEATHGIDTTASRKKRRRPGSTDEYSVLSPSPGLNSATPLRSDEADDPLAMESSPKAIKTEHSSCVDAMVETIPPPRQHHHLHQAVKKSVNNVSIGTNTDMPMPDDNMDDLENGSLESVVRLRNNPVIKGSVEQGVQYCEEDLLVPDNLPKRELMEQEIGEETEEEMYSSQHYVTTISGQDLGDGHFQTSDGQFIDTSSNQIVMSSDGELVGFMPVEAAAEQQQQSPVVNISTTTNEQGQQVVIIENLHHHSQELQKEIINALMAENNLIQLPN